jgi:hypothetical protein
MDGQILPGLAPTSPTSLTDAALERLRVMLADLGLEPKAAKIRIVYLEEGGEGFDFLGFYHRLVRSKGTTGLSSLPAGLRTGPCSMLATGSGN